MSEAATIARPYAKAVFELAEASKSTKEWSILLKNLALIAATKEMQQVLNNPLVTSDQITSLFIDLLGVKITEEAEHFIAMLAERKRLLVLPAVSKVYEDCLAQAERTMDVDVISAYPIDQARLKKLQSALEIRLNRQVTMHVATDANLLGGAIIKAGDQVIDGSLRSKLNQLSERLSS